MWKRVAEVAAGTALVCFAFATFGIPVDATTVLVVAGVIAVLAAAERKKKNKPRTKSGGGLLAALAILTSDSHKGYQAPKQNHQSMNIGAAIAQQKSWQAQQAQRDAMARAQQAQRDAMARQAQAQRDAMARSQYGR